VMVTGLVSMGAEHTQRGPVRSSGTFGRFPV
jgi:hypothetical protein